MERMMLPRHIDPDCSVSKVQPSFFNRLSSLYALRSNIETREASQRTGPLLPLALLMMSS